MVNDLSLRDRMLIQGAGALKDSELLAILIGSGPSGKTAHDYFLKGMLQFRG
jgi:DNA repair protein RadC